MIKLNSKAKKILVIQGSKTFELSYYYLGRGLRSPQIILTGTRRE